MSLLSVLTGVDKIHTRTLLMANHSQHRAHQPDQLRGQVTNTRRSGGHEIRGQFVQSYEAGDADAGLRVTLTVPDEEKVEFFEVESPSGVTQILSKFEDGMVYFTFDKRSIETGVWKYRAMLYADTVIEDHDIITVDAVLNTKDHPVDVTSEAFVSESAPWRVFTRLHDDQHPVTGANISATVLLPDHTEVRIQLYDNGLGYPDTTHQDGVYSGYLPTLASLPGHYSLVVSVEQGSSYSVSGKNIL